jgi:hypothetical protein
MIWRGSVPDRSTGHRHRRSSGTSSTSSCSTCASKGTRRRRTGERALAFPLATCKWAVGFGPEVLDASPPSLFLGAASSGRRGSTWTRSTSRTSCGAVRAMRRSGTSAGSPAGSCRTLAPPGSSPRSAGGRTSRLSTGELSRVLGAKLSILRLFFLFHRILGCAEFQLLGCAGFSVFDCAESAGSCRRINSEEGEGLVNDLKAVAPYDGDVAKMVAALENFRYDGMEMARLRAESV